MVSTDEVAVNMAAIVTPSEQLDAVESPASASSAFALSRFEFETGRGNDGTKVLMAEWDPSTAMAGAGSPAESRPNSEDWEVTWEGMSAALPVWDKDAGTDSDGRACHRVYFLLPPGAQIPPIVHISLQGKSVSPHLQTKPMPAIFPRELTGGEDTTGKRGVLHTMWAEKRLAKLQAEVEAEMKTNGESVGLEMVMQECQWIIDHFGLPPAEGISHYQPPHVAQHPTRIQFNPRSPIGGRLGEKLRGLKLATSPIDLAAAVQASSATSCEFQSQASSASHFTTPDTVRSTPASASTHDGSGAVGKDVIMSLNAVLETGTVSTTTTAVDPDTDEELFALPMSPRSPEMKKSPFSFL